MFLEFGGLWRFSWTITNGALRRLPALNNTVSLRRDEYLDVQTCF